MVAVTFFLRDVTFVGSGFLLGTLVLPSILGMNVSLGMISMSQQLTLTVLTLVAVCLAALIPAVSAAWRDPVRALRVP